MKKHIVLKIWLCFFLFCNSICLFAQPGDDNPDGNLEGNDPAGAPVENKILTAIIIILIIGFCLKKFKHLKKMEQS